MQMLLTEILTVSADFYFAESVAYTNIVVYFQVYKGISQ